jgi:hypothetical protein
MRNILKTKHMTHKNLLSLKTLRRVSFITTATTFIGISLFQTVAVSALPQEFTDALKSGVYYADPYPDCNAPEDTSAPPGGAVAPGGDNEKAAFQFFESKGLSPQMSAAIVGNLMQESGVNPTAKNPTSGAYGIGQWLGTRYSNLQAYASQNNGSINDFNIQIGFLWFEVTKGTEAGDGALSHMKQESNLDNMTFDWENYYERAGEHMGDQPMTNRINNAHSVLTRYGNGAPPTTTPAGGGIGGTSANTSCGNPASGAVGATGHCSNNGTMKGTASILSCAEQFDPYGYVWGGGHIDPQAFMQTFDAQGGFNGKFRGTVDCSGLVNVSVWLAFHQKIYTVASNSSYLGTGVFRQITASQIQPGDLLVHDGDHVGIATIAGDDHHNFAAHTANTDQADQIGPSDAPGFFTSYFRYTGPGS